MIEWRLSVIESTTGLPGPHAASSLRASDCRAPSCTKSAGDRAGNTIASCALMRSGTRIAACVATGRASAAPPRDHRGASQEASREGPLGARIELLLNGLRDVGLAVKEPHFILFFRAVDCGGFCPHPNVGQC